MQNNNEDLFGAYISDNDNNGNESNAANMTNTNEQNDRPVAQVTPQKGGKVFSSATQVNPDLMGVRGANVKNTQPVSESPITNVKRPDDGLHYADNLGYINVDVKSLPTGGLFYPDDTKILIRAARGNEIKHWSTMNDQDLDQLSQVDDILNYIIEKCVSVKMPNQPGGGSWKDIKDVDRFYLLFAIRDFTFPDGDNELMVPISEAKNIPVTKEMIDFIKIPDEIMKYYSNEEKCFVFDLPSRKLHMYIPSLGATQWLKNYAQAKTTAREGFDQDFLIFAPMLISDFRLLSQRAYEGMVEESTMWTAKEWSLISYIRDTLASVSEPKLTYTDENGAEVTIPLTFRGGIKALFTVQDPLSILR